MKVEKYLNSTDWDFYIERAGSVFWASLSADAYYLRMNDIAGIGFHNQLTHFKNGIAIFYRSKKEMEKILRRLAFIVDSEPNRIQGWIDKEEQLAKKFENFDKSYNYKDSLDNYYQIFLYNTILPYLVLKSFEYVKNKDKKLQATLEKIRGRSYYQPFIKEYIKPHFAKVAKKLDIEEGLVNNMTMREVASVLEDKKINLNKDDLLKRSKECYYYWDKEKQDLQFFYGHLDGLEVKVDKNIKKIEGQVAFRGKVRGMVKIVNLIEDMDKFEEGNILVSIATNPALTLAIKKAAALISDEGGSLCHTSIIARELKIPGVVGTKIATKVLKDGDMVEVDANKGVIKKLKL